MPERFLWFSEEDILKLRKLLGERFSERTAQGCQVKPNNIGKGYPQITWKGESYGAHRVAYAVWKQAVPFNWWVCHLCSNKQCVNPSHLELRFGTDNTHKPPKERTQSLPWPSPPPGIWEPKSPLEVMAFPKSMQQQTPNRDLEKLAFPASYPVDEK